MDKISLIERLTIAINQSHGDFGRNQYLLERLNKEKEIFESDRKDLERVLELKIPQITYEQKIVKKIKRKDGEYTVTLTNTFSRETISSKVNVRGEAIFANLKPGIYSTDISSGNESEDQFWPVYTLELIGDKSNFNIFREHSENDDSLDDIDLSECNCVAFRLNDVQDYWLNDVQINIMEEFHKEEIPLTIGVIASAFGNDQKITEFVKNSENLEIASKGYDLNTITEQNKEEQKETILKSLDTIEENLEIRPKVLIPPQNRFNENTVEVLTEIGIAHLSGSIINEDSPPFPLKNSELYRFPQITSTGSYDIEQGLFVGKDSNTVLEEIKIGLEDYGFVVVGMQPQEFATIDNGVYSNESNIQQFERL